MCMYKILRSVLFIVKLSLNVFICSLVVNAVLIVDVQKFVFDPADLLGRLFAGLMVQTVLLIKLSQAHHGFLTYTPLYREKEEGRKTDQGGQI